jgi:hypothetical protein
MKVNIQKFNAGGFASFVPIRSQPSQMPTTTKKQPEEAASSGLIDDKLFKDLIGKGLINDVNQFVKEVIALESNSSQLIGDVGRSNSLKMIARLNEIQQNKSLWDETLKVSEKSGGLGEVAVGTNGEVFVKDNKGKIKSMSLEKYKESPTRLLTVGELLNEREINPKLTFDRSIFTVAKNSVGLTKITDHVRTLMQTLSEYSEINEKYVSKKQVAENLAMLQAAPPSQTTLAAIQDLEEILETPGDFYKIYSKEAGKRKNIDKALNYIWTTLGTESQHKLKAVSVINGKDNPKELIVDMLLSYTEPTLEHKITPIREELITGKESTTGDKSLTSFQFFNKGLLPTGQFKFNNSKADALLKGVIGSTGALVDDKDKAIGMTSLRTIFQDLGYNRLLDTNYAYFGDKQISLANQDNVVYDPNATSGLVYLPTNGDSVDWDSVDEFKDIYAIYEANKKVWSKKEAEDFFDQHNWEITIDEINGEKVIRSNAFVKPFLVTYGYTNSATGLTKDNKYVSKLAKDEKEEVKSLLESIWITFSGKRKIDNTPDKSFHREQYYGGIVTVPYRKGFAVNVDAIVGQGATNPIPTLGQVQAKQKSPLLNSNIAGIVLND